MTPDEVMHEIFRMEAANPFLHGVVNDLLFTMRYPDKCKIRPSAIAHAKIGENTLWSVKVFEKRRKEIYGNGLSPNGAKDVYNYTGDWDVCDDCGEFTLCTTNIQNLTTQCSYCRAKKFVDESCDKSENLDGELMRAYLQTGKIDPTLRWFSQSFYDELEKTYHYTPPSPIMPYNSATASVPPFPVGNGQFIVPNGEPYIPLPKHKFKISLDAAKKMAKSLLCFEDDL